MRHQGQETNWEAVEVPLANAGNDLGTSKENMD